MSTVEVAQAFGFSTDYIYHMLGRDVPVWERRKWSSRIGAPVKDPERDRKIVELRYDGWNLREIADEFGLTRQRVHQILRRMACGTG